MRGERLEIAASGVFLCRTLTQVLILTLQGLQELFLLLQPFLCEDLFFKDQQL